MNKEKSNWRAVYTDSRSSPWTPESWKGYCEDGADAQRKYRQSKEQYLALKHLRLSPDDIILEAGCGYGRITEHLLATGVTVVGCDISSKMVEFCKQRFRDFRSFSSMQLDLSKLPFPDNTFDKVLCNGVLMHVDDFENSVSELSRVLRIGGRLVISSNSTFCPFVQIALLQRSFIRFVKKLTHKQSIPNIKWEPYSPISVVNFLQKQKLEILALESDTLFCADYRIPKLNLPILLFGLSLYKTFDSVVCDKFPFYFFGWEVWFVAQKNYKKNR